MKRQSILILAIMLFATVIGSTVALGKTIYVDDGANGLNTTTVEALDTDTNVPDSGSIDFAYAQPANQVAGELTQDTTLSGTCILEDTVIVPSGRVLNIEPGTAVLMKDAVTLIVYGQLLAVGNENEPIRFTNYRNGTWKQIMFVEAADSRLKHCIIEYADSEGQHQDYYSRGRGHITKQSLFWQVMSI